MYTVQEMDNRWWVIEPDSGGRAISDSLYEADARRIARALNRDAAMGEVREALGEVTGDDPIYNDAEEGSFCVHCHARMCYVKQECIHTPDCAYVKCEKALAALDAAEVAP